MLLPRVVLSFAVLVLTCQTILHAGAKSAALLELKVGKTAYQGKLVARSPHYGWLLDRNGELNAVTLSEVDSFRKISTRFSPLPANEIRSQLTTELGRNFSAASTRHYIVCAARGDAQKYAAIFEEIYRVFHLHFSVRGFQVAKPEFPLVAVVFPDRKSFDAQCRKDGVRASRTLMGYYMPANNRVSLFDSGAETVTLQREKPAGYLCFDCQPGKRRAPTIGEIFNDTPQLTPFANINGTLKDTIVHEATHQVAFNTGMHSRIGESPQWVVEGLATVFEAPGIRSSSGGKSASARVNHERFIWFRNFVKKRRSGKSLSAFIESDNLFQSATLDAYSQAWALTFYLIETRPREYATYLKTIAQRDPLYKYPASERLEDFQKVFGEKMDLFEAQFLRFIDRIKL